MRLRYRGDQIIAKNIDNWQELSDKAVEHAIQQNIPFEIDAYSVEIDLYGEYDVYAFTTIDYLADTLYPEADRLIADSKDSLGYVEDV